MKNFQEYFRQSGLIIKYLKGELTDPEKDQLESWLNENEQNRTLFNKLTEEHFIGHELEVFRLLEKDTDWEKVLSEINDQSKSQVSYIGYRWTRYAAAIILMIGIGAGIYSYKHSFGKKQAEVAIAEIVPGGNKAVLVLEDGRKIALDEAGKGEIARQANMIISKTGDGQLVYDISASAAPAIAAKQKQYNAVTTPRGGQYRIVLPDGSKVWLNAASSLRYPTKFDDQCRLVELDGEAYFEINQLKTKVSGKEKRIPFRVVSGEHVVEVLGTHFNVSSYEDERMITTTLLEGKVRVVRAEPGEPRKKQVAVMLNPGEQSVMSLREPEKIREISVRPVDTEETVAWKNGQFQFRDADLHTIMRQIARWYDVDVQFQGNMPVTKFRGKISRDVPVSELLKILHTSGVNFKTEGRKIIITS